MEIETSRLYADNYEALLPDGGRASVVINQGGTSSSKTYSILQVLFTLLSERANLVCTVIGQDIPNLKAGALRDAESILDNSPDLRALIASYNKSDRVYTWHNGSLMEFKSYDSAQDAKSGKRDFAFFNEANGVPKPIYDEVALRTKERVFLDYNPNARFWAHDLIDTPGVLFLRSWYVHNPFLSPQIKAKIERYRDTDADLWKVYGLGLTGKIEGLVYRNWTEVDAVPQDAKFIGRGLDFGFTNDPTAAVDVYSQDGKLYLDEVLYLPGLTNPDINARLRAADPLAHTRQIVGDSAEPKSLEELRRMGLRVEPAVKGADSVNAGIGVLKQYQMLVTRRSVNLRKELMNYKWKVDRLTGEATNAPVDAFNHLLDGARYVALNKLQRASGIRSRATR
jgi:phage terminase large subunit